MKSSVLAVSALLLLAFWTRPELAHAEERHKNLDFVLILDDSRSMSNKIEAVKSFLDEEILQRFVIPGDTVTVIVFHGTAKVLLSLTIQGGSDLRDAETKLAEVKADGRYTDIGNALDFTQAWVAHNLKTQNRHYFVLLTDGRQEAPPGSKYGSNDFSVHHPLLENAKIIPKKGWQVEILGIGIDSEVKSLADDLVTEGQSSQKP